MEPDRVEILRKLLNERLGALLNEAGATLGDLTDDKENPADALDLASEESNRNFQLRIRDRERVLIARSRKRSNGSRPASTASAWRAGKRSPRSD